MALAAYFYEEAGVELNCMATCLVARAGIDDMWSWAGEYIEQREKLASSGMDLYTVARHHILYELQYTSPSPW